jgi:hypothetical protein
MLKHWRKIAVWAALAAYVVGLWIWKSYGFPIEKEICEKAANSAQHNCPSYNVGLIALWKVGEAFSDFTFIAALISAVATAFIAYFTFTLKRSTDNLWRITNDTLEHSEKTAERQLRAYVSANTADVAFAGTEIKVLLKVKNSGQTPAYKFNVNADGVFFLPGKEGPQTATFNQVAHNPTTGAIIGPGDIYEVSHVIKLTDQKLGGVNVTVEQATEMVNLIQNSRAALYVNGRMDYETFGKNQTLYFRYLTVRNIVGVSQNPRWDFG